MCCPYRFWRWITRRRWPTWKAWPGGWWPGAAWSGSPACLAFHQGTRPVRTPGVSQVRQPLYQRPVARWKHYEQA
jgi:hypothetical protein